MLHLRDDRPGVGQHSIPVIREVIWLVQRLQPIDAAGMSRGNLINELQVPLDRASAHLLIGIMANDQVEPYALGGKGLEIERLQSYG